MTKVKAIETSDGRIFKDIEAAKIHELELLVGTEEPGNAAAWIVGNTDKILDVLTMKATSHPAARKANGASRKPRTAKPATPAKPEAA